jgi:hypothetical protein
MRICAPMFKPSHVALIISSSTERNSPSVGHLSEDRRWSVSRGNEGEMGREGFIYINLDSGLTRVRKSLLLANSGGIQFVCGRPAGLSWDADCE